MAAEEWGHKVSVCFVGTRGDWDLHQALHGLQGWGLLPQPSHTQKPPCIVMVNLTDAGVDALKTTIIIVVVVVVTFSLKLKSKPFKTYQNHSMYLTKKVKPRLIFKSIFPENAQEGCALCC